MSYDRLSSYLTLIREAREWAPTACPVCEQKKITACFSDKAVLTDSVLVILCPQHFDEIEAGHGKHRRITGEGKEAIEDIRERRDYALGEGPTGMTE